MLTQHKSAMSSPALIGERTTESLDRARSAPRSRVVEPDIPAAPDRPMIFEEPA